MKKMIVLTIVAFLMAGLFKTGATIGGLIMAACWIVGTVILYKYIFAIMWRFLKSMWKIFNNIWDFFLYKL